MYKVHGGIVYHGDDTVSVHIVENNSREKSICACKKKKSRSVQYNYKL